jgi:antitoxin ParD1/3/4
MATTTMNVSQPVSMKEFIDERLAGGGYGTASEYVRELIRADQKQRDEHKLEKLLLERLRSGTEAKFDIEDVRTGLAKRLSKKK